MLPPQKRHPERSVSRPLRDVQPKDPESLDIADTVRTFSPTIDSSHHKVNGGQFVLHNHESKPRRGDAITAQGEALGYGTQKV